MNTMRLDQVWIESPDKVWVWEKEPFAHISSIRMLWEDKSSSENLNLYKDEPVTILHSDSSIPNDQAGFVDHVIKMVKLFHRLDDVYDLRFAANVMISVDVDKFEGSPLQYLDSLEDVLRPYGIKRLIKVVLTKSNINEGPYNLYASDLYRVSRIRKNSQDLIKNSQPWINDTGDRPIHFAADVIAIPSKLYNQTVTKTQNYPLAGLRVIVKDIAELQAFEDSETHPSVANDIFELGANFIGEVDRLPFSTTALEAKRINGPASARHNENESNFTENVINPPIDIDYEYVDAALVRGAFPDIKSPCIGLTKSISELQLNPKELDTTYVVARTINEALKLAGIWLTAQPYLTRKPDSITIPLELLPERLRSEHSSLWKHMDQLASEFGIRLRSLDFGATWWRNNARAGHSMTECLELFSKTIRDKKSQTPSSIDNDDSGSVPSVNPQALQRFRVLTIYDRVDGPGVTEQQYQTALHQQRVFSSWLLSTMGENDWLILPSAHNWLSAGLRDPSSFQNLGEDIEINALRGGLHVPMSADVPLLTIPGKSVILTSTCVYTFILTYLGGEGQYSSDESSPTQEPSIIVAVVSTERLAALAPHAMPEYLKRTPDHLVRDIANTQVLPSAVSPVQSNTELSLNTSRAPEDDELRAPREAKALSQCKPRVPFELHDQDTPLVPDRPAAVFSPVVVEVWCNNQY